MRGVKVLHSRWGDVGRRGQGVGVEGKRVGTGVGTVVEGRVDADAMISNVIFIAQFTIRIDLELLLRLVLLVTV